MNVFFDEILYGYGVSHKPGDKILVAYTDHDPYQGSFLWIADNIKSVFFTRWQHWSRQRFLLSECFWVLLLMLLFDAHHL